MYEFTHADRCDRCGALGLNRATLNDSELILCNHHYHEHEDKLVLAGWTVESYVAPTAPVELPAFTE